MTDTERDNDQSSLLSTGRGAHVCLEVRFESLQGPNGAWLLVDYIVTPCRLLSLYGIIYVTWYINHLYTGVCDCMPGFLHEGD